jgi:hypothetical protein
MRPSSLIIYIRYGISIARSRHLAYVDVFISSFVFVGESFFYSAFPSLQYNRGHAPSTRSAPHVNTLSKSPIPCSCPMIPLPS